MKYTLPTLLFSICFVTSIMSQEIELGIHRSNFIWLEQDKVEEIMDEIKNIDSDFIRISAVKGRGSIESVLEHISYANNIGLKVLLIINLSDSSFFPKETKKVLNGQGWWIYRVQDINHEMYSSRFSKLCQEIQERNLKVEAMEFMNEANWSEFNGDLPTLKYKDKVTSKMVDLGEGFIMNANSKIDDTKESIIQAMINYGELIQKTSAIIHKEISKEIRPKLITSGAVFGYTEETVTWIKKSGNTLIDPRYLYDLLLGKTEYSAINYLENIDGFGLHYYPRNMLTKKKAKYNIKKYLLPIAQYIDMDIWITESGVKTKYCFDDENLRYKAVKNNVEAVKKYTSNIKHIVLYSYDQDENQLFTKNGKILPVAKIFKREEE